MNDEAEALRSVAALVGLPGESLLPENELLFRQLCAYLNELIEKDFNRLVTILYRIDVSEAKVRVALAEAPKDVSAGEIIAQLIIERERQKMEWRRKYKSGEL